ncbi:MAG: sigma 54-interacting transcriptional regulator, partial [Gemmataceae bacterium]
PVQAKLLRVLEFDEVLPVGGNQPQPLKLRILSATHRDLAREVEQGRFRHDLYFRLNGFQIHLPRLKDRGDDVVDLAQHFLRQLEPSSPLLPAGMAQFLKARSWPGNVRELRHALEHAVIVARGGPLLPEHFPPPAATPQPQDVPGQIAVLVRRWVEDRAATGGEPANLYDAMLNVVEPALVGEVLVRTQGNRVAASRWLGLARATVRKLIAKYLPGEVNAAEEGD